LSILIETTKTEQPAGEEAGEDKLGNTRHLPSSTTTTGEKILLHDGRGFTIIKERA